MVRTFSDASWRDLVTALAGELRRPVPPAVVLARLNRLSYLLDSALSVPGTRLRFGADAALSLVPGVGPVVGFALSSYILVEALRLGLPARTLMRMLANIAIDLAISSIPLIGWLGDLFFKANNRNMEILRAHLSSRMNQEYTS